MLNDDEKLDLLFQYLESFKESDKDLNQFLTELAQIRPELAETIAEFRKSHADAENWFSALAGSLDEIVEERFLLVPGDVVGAFEVAECIGKGGMSQVYRAERNDGQFDQTVAVKILDAPLNRFHQEFFKKEKEILASLSHPNIAQIYDADIMPDGRPYYIMEYIDGMPVDDFVTSHSLSEKEIIKLVLDISKAISFAHQNLVIHKDIKPKNIFVDTNGIIKLLDFGISVSVGSEDDEAGSFPHFATPGYITPEMEKNEAVNITSDIFQLGLVIHKLLTGKNPQDTSKSHESEIELDEEAVRSNELLAIIRKSVRKHPDERFQSVDGLIHELENHLKCNPVETYSTSRLYLIGKFIMRNKRLTRVTVLFVLLIISFTGFHIFELRNEREKAEQNAAEARVEAERARATVDYLKNVFYQADPFLKNNRASSMMDSVLFIAYEQLADEMPKQPVTKAEVLIALGDIFSSRDMHQKCVEVNRKALKILDTLKGRNASFYRSRAYSALATIHVKNFNIDSADYYIQKALAIDSSDTSVNNEYLAYDLETRGRISAVKKEYDDALRYYNEAVQRYLRSTLEDADILIAGAKSMIGEIYSKQGKYDIAKDYLEESLQIHTNKLGEENGYVLNDYGKLTELYINTGDYAKAESFCKKSIALTRQIYGDSSLQLINDLKYMGYIYSETGDYESAINRGKEAVGLSVRHFGDTHYNTSRAYNDLGMMYVHAGRNDEAIAYLKQSLSIKEKRKAVDSSSVMVSKYNIANAHLQSDKPGRAVDLLEEVFAFERNSYGENNISVAITMRLLAQAYIDNNELEKVPEMLEKCTGVMENGYDDDNRRLAELYLSWSEYYLKKAAFSDSEFYAHKALDIYEALYPDDYWGVAYAKALSAFISYKQGFWTKTEKERYLSNIKVLKSQDTKRDYLVQKLEM